MSGCDIAVSARQKYPIEHLYTGLAIQRLLALLFAAVVDLKVEVEGNVGDAPVISAKWRRHRRSAQLDERIGLIANWEKPIDQRIPCRSIAAEIALHSREEGEVTRENEAMKKLAAQFNSVH
jgi:hypothetical protein